MEEAATGSKTPQASSSIPEPCHKCGWKLRRSDCATIEDGITHCICYNCGQEWVE